MRSRQFAVLLALVAVLLVGSAALAAGATTATDVELHETFGPQPDFNPCTGDPGASTLTVNLVSHNTILPDGRFVAVFSQKGSYLFQPTDSSLPSYTGRFAVHETQRLTGDGATDISVNITINARGSDGSILREHVVSRVSFTAAGMTVGLDKMTCI
jgi:hypothetical protein